MRCVVKMLLDVEALDDPEARKIFRRIGEGVVRAVESQGTIRTLKIVEDGSGRPIDRIETEGDDVK